MVAAPWAAAARTSAQPSSRVWRLPLSRASDALAVAAVLPLLTSLISGGLRLGTSDVVLASLSSAEAPLSIRSGIGIWAMGLALVWFGLAYRSRTFAPWEPALIALGGAAALLRVGNAWLDAFAVVLPLGRQLRLLRLPTRVSIGAALACVGVAVALVLTSRPPALPRAAVHAAQTAPADARAFADWRWASELQQQLGPGGTVLGAGGLTSETPAFWTDYVRVSLGHELWADILRRRAIDVVVLNSNDQSAAAQLVRASPDWQVLADADGALVARRSGP